MKHVKTDAGFKSLPLMLGALPWYLWVCLIAGMLQLLRLLWFDLRLSLFKAPPAPFGFPPISVIISARNEEDNLMEFLPVLLSQDYPEYEVIVVDDASVDGTEAVVRAYQKSHPRLRLRHIEDHDTFRGRKKYALTLGIKMASYEWLVFTDADCRPAGDKWLQSHAAAFMHRPLVLGYGAYMPDEHFNFLNFFIRTDTLLIALQYMGAALGGLPYMGVGRNLGYHKKLFFEGKGFYHHMQLPSGDDDLFVNAVGRKAGAGVMLNPQSLTYSIPEKSWQAWSRQKSRHVGTFVHYTLLSRAMLILFKAAFYVMWAGSLLLLFTPWIGWGAAIIVMWYLLRSGLAFKPSRLLGENQLWLTLPFTELALEFVYVYLLRQRIVDLLNPWKNH